MKTYDEQCTNREQVVEGLSGWKWVTQDNGAWDGPVKDWEDSHKERYFKYIKSKGIVVCAGGNCGLYPRIFAKYFQTVYTFEPDPLNFHCLVNNCQVDNVIKLNAALGMEHKMVEVFRQSMENVGMHRVVDNVSATIPQLCIDDLALKRLDFIQLDVEGYEYDVVRGAANSISKFKPVIACENGNEKILSYLSQWGYKTAEQSVSDTLYAVI